VGLITIDYRDRKLIYEQLIDNVKMLVLRGDLKKNDYLPSVRTLAKELRINPNTIQKAYAELERQGIIASLSGRGSIVILDGSEIASAGKESLRAETTILASKARTLHMTREEFLECAASIWQAAEPDTGKETEQND
jgi:GntR family transcriptional regulator